MRTYELGELLASRTVKYNYTPQIEKPKVRVELIKNGHEVLVIANRSGLKFLADVCTRLAEAEHDAPHYHIEEALYTAESDSVPMEILLKPDL